MKLEAIITADTSRLEKAYREAVSASRATARQMDEAFENSLRFDFDTGSLRSRLSGLVDLVRGKVSAGFSSLGGIIGRPFASAAASIRGSNEIIKESVESVSSEIIESFGIDGDVANMLANELVKVRLSSLLLGGAVAGLAGGMVFLTAAFAKNAAELRSTAQLTGIDTDQLQRYQSAANIAGTETNALTDAIKDLREQAKEAIKGNIEAATTFQQLGISASLAATDPAAAFEKFLDQLETIPDVQQRVAITQKVLGSASEETRKAILALTDANGALRDRVNELGVALDKQAVEDLARLNKEWNILSETVTTFLKRTGLAAIKAFDALGEIGNTSGESASFFAEAQGKAGDATKKTTDAVKDQAGALNVLRQQIASVRLEAIEKEVSEGLTQIAFNARTAAEAIAAYQKRLAMDDDFYASESQQQRYKKNLEALEKLRNPDKQKKPRADVSELEQLTKQLREAKKDLQSFQNFSSKEFDLRLDLEAARDLKSQSEEILKLRRELGEPIGVPFPDTTKGAEEELRKLNALKTARELLKKQDFDLGAAFREQFNAENERRRSILDSFEQIQNELLRATGQDVAATGAELGTRFAEAMANAIREGRTDIVDAINQITDIERTRAESGESRQRLGVIEAGVEAQDVRLQNQVNQGIISETQARKELLKTQAGVRDAILDELYYQQFLAYTIEDAAEAARLGVEIERASALGREGVSERIRSVEETIASNFDSFVDTLVDGSASMGDALKGFAKSLVSDIARELQSSLVESLTGGASKSIGAYLGKTITGFLSGLFRADGGPVAAGRPYIVGERGPEWFVPNASGQVMNARQTAQMMNQQPAGAVNNFYFQISAPDGRISRESQAQIASRTAAALGQASRRNS